MLDNAFVRAVAAYVQNATDRMMTCDEATVTAVQTAPNRVVVAYRDGTYTLPYLTSYTPTVGDVVWVTGPLNNWFVLGKWA